jgi:hypothetical protein
MNSLSFRHLATSTFAFLLICVYGFQSTLAQAPGQAIAPALEQQFGLSESQVRGALGALLVFARERLPKSDFDDLAQRIPNAERIMQDVKMSGIVTRPLGSISDYEKCLERLGIGQPLASRFAPAVVDQLRSAGFDSESDRLWRVLH